MKDKRTGQFIETHGMRKTRFYSIWTNLKTRCNNKKYSQSEYYSKKGVKVNWKSFEDFKQDMHKSYLEHCRKFGVENTSIDRINNNGNYSKENCKWSTAKEQASNRKSNVLYKYNNETKTLKEWSLFFNVNYKNVWNRINKLNWSFERALLK